MWSFQYFLAALAFPLACSLGTEPRDESVPESPGGGSPVGRWTLVVMGGEHVGSSAGVELVVTPTSESGATSYFASGFSGCNNYASPLTAKGNQLTVDQLSATTKSCGTAVLLHEERYFSRLGAVSFHTAGPEKLELFDRDKRVTLVFARVVDAPTH